MKKHLGKYILTSCLGAIVATTPIFASYSQIDNSICQSVTKNDLIVDENTYGITLSKYEIHSWTDISQTIQVFNSGVALTNVTWTSDDESKFTVNPNPDQEGHYTVNFHGGWTEKGPNESKIHAYWKDDQGYTHTAACAVKLLNGNSVTSDNDVYDYAIKQGTTGDKYFDFKTRYEDFTELSKFKVDVSDNWDIFFESFSLNTSANKLQLRVTPRSDARVGRATFTIYNSKHDQSKQYATKVNILIVNNLLSIQEGQKITTGTTISTRVNDDSQTLTPLLNGVATTTKGNVKWFSSDPLACSFKTNDTDDSIKLQFHKATTEPVILACYETIATECVNYAACYINISDSHLTLSVSGGEKKQDWKLDEGGFQLSASLDDTSIPSDKVTWATSKSEIAQVDSNGKVTFSGLGNVTITATYKNSNDVEFKDSYSFVIKWKELKSTPSEIVAFKTSTPEKITATLDGVAVPANELMFISTNTSVVTVDETGQLTYVGTGRAEVHCIYKEFYYLQEYDAVTSVTIANPSMEMTLEYYETHIGTHDAIDHYVPKVQVGGVEIPIGTPGLTWEASEGLSVDETTGLFWALNKGQYQLTCRFEIEGQVLTQSVKVYAQDFYVNDFDTEEPTIITLASTLWESKTFQLTYWFDYGRTESIEILSATSSNTKRATVTNDGLITFKGHGKCDITCVLKYVHKNGDVETKTAIVHLQIKVWWWGWLAAGLTLGVILIIIIIIIVVVKKKKKAKGSKNSKRKPKSKKPVNKKSKTGKKGKK